MKLACDPGPGEAEGGGQQIRGQDELQSKTPLKTKMKMSEGQSHVSGPK